MAFVYESIQIGQLHFVDPTTRDSYKLNIGDRVTTPFELPNGYLNVLKFVEEVSGVYLGDGGATATINGLSVPAHDFINNTYDGKNLTKVEYYVGGAGGTLVATVDMTYDVNGNVITVSRS